MKMSLPLQSCFMSSIDVTIIASSGRAQFAIATARSDCTVIAAYGAACTVCIPYLPNNPSASLEYIRTTSWSNPSTVRGAAVPSALVSCVERAT